MGPLPPPAHWPSNPSRREGSAPLDQPHSTRPRERARCHLLPKAGLGQDWGRTGAGQFRKLARPTLIIDDETDCSKWRPLEVRLYVCVYVMDEHRIESQMAKLCRE